MKVVLLTTLILCLQITAYTQDKQLSTSSQSITTLLCQKWVLSSMSVQGKSANVPPSEAVYVTYKADGSYMDSSARFSVSHGTWTYDSKTQLLNMGGKGDKAKTKIVKVTHSELVMEMKYPAVTMNAIYKRVD